jgi:hypothetical protein
MSKVVAGVSDDCFLSCYEKSLLQAFLYGF